MKKYFAVLSNELIKAVVNSDLSSTEIKILLSLISLITPEDKNFDTVEIKMSEFCRYWNMSCGGNQRKTVKNAVEILQNSEFYLNGDKKRWLTESSTIDGRKLLLQLDSSLSEYLIELTACFTLLDMDIVSTLKHKYSIQTYMMLKSVANQGFYNIGLADAFKKICNNKYKVKSQFIDNVLKPTLEEINNKTDIIVSYNIKKPFARPEMITFNISNKKSISITKPKPKNSLNNIKAISKPTERAFTQSLYNPYAKIDIFIDDSEYEETYKDDLLDDFDLELV